MSAEKVILCWPRWPGPHDWEIQIYIVSTANNRAFPKTN